ncbi:MAG: CvpA family protein [Chitinophagales bacterium]|jgi:membrane protein required for colicin V production|nr:CvpA family protein [Chitinophagales bacterium]HNI44148.1 CvpA family protein [Chitinophagales bacterium]HNL07949.1 CvpA family protein [Chitinophagales bacterium]
MTLNAIDLAYIVMLGYGIYKGVNQGLIGSVLSFFRFIISIVLALRFSFIVSRTLERVANIDPAVTPILSFFVLFITLMVGMFLMGLVLNYFVKAAHLSSLNRSFGIGLWAFVLTLCFSFLTSLADKGGMLPSELKLSSWVYPRVAPIADIMMCKMAFILPASSSILQSLEDGASRVASLVVGECR